MSRAENPAYTPVRITASHLVKNGPGTCGGFFVASGTPTVEVFDGIDNTGAVILGPVVTAAATPYPLPAQFTDGLYVQVTGTGDITFFI